MRIAHFSHTYPRAQRTRPQKTCNSTKCIPRQFLLTECTPTPPYITPSHTQQTSSEKKKWHRAVCTAQNPVPTAREVSYITLINWDSARQMVSSKKRSGLIWIERGCQILNIKDLTAKMAKKIYIYKNLKHLTPKVHFSFKSASVWSTAKTTSCILHAVSVPPVMAVNNE